LLDDVDVGGLKPVSFFALDDGIWNPPPCSPPRDTLAPPAGGIGWPCIIVRTPLLHRTKRQVTRTIHWETPNQPIKRHNIMGKISEKMSIAITKNRKLNRIHPITDGRSGTLSGAGTHMVMRHALGRWHRFFGPAIHPHPEPYIHLSY
jgi:hypothetical protein